MSYELDSGDGKVMHFASIENARSAGEAFARAVIYAGYWSFDGQFVRQALLDPPAGGLPRGGSDVST